LFEPGSGSPPKQVYDLNGGVAPSGLFWTIQLPEDALTISKDGKTAVLTGKNIPVVDSFEFGGQNIVPATASFEIKWTASGASVARGSGSAVDPKDQAAFSGNFSPAKATGTFSGKEAGFTFTSKPGANTDDSFATIGKERNGTFLK
jgi:hypothetical protein